MAQECKLLLEILLQTSINIKVNITDQDLLLVYINHGRCHWTLLVCKGAPIELIIIVISGIGPAAQAS